jgi:hypothetical protein
VRRAFKQKTADQPAADVDCTEPLSPVCDCRLHSGYDDAANLLADWRINVIHGHDEEYLGFPPPAGAHPIFHHRLPLHFNGLCSMCRGEQLFRAHGCRARCHVSPTGPPKRAQASLVTA